MKLFNFQHLVFGTDKAYNEDAMPSWLTGKENKWFLDECVLTLDVGQFVDTDFQRITRVA